MCISEYMWCCIAQLCRSDPLEPLFPLPIPAQHVRRSMNADELGMIRTCERLQFVSSAFSQVRLEADLQFLSTAPTFWAGQIETVSCPPASIKLTVR